MFVAVRAFAILLFVVVVRFFFLAALLLLPFLAVACLACRPALALLVPRIMDESVGVNAIVSILAISAFGLLFGILGAILAIPLAAILQILLNRVLFQDPTELAGEPALSIQQSRDRFSVLRLEAQELAQDVRKQARSESNAEENTRLEEEATDTIELLASELDTLLIGMEGTA